MAKSSIALAMAASFLSAQAQTYTASVLTGPSASYAAATYTVTQDTGADVPLFEKNFTYPYLPYKADSGDGPRGTMQGYNMCNTTTAGDTSMCATAFLNDAEDFCLWGAPALSGEPLEEVANIEGEMVAYCTSPKHGARVIPAGAITGLQFIKTPDYVEIVGMIDQTALHLEAADSGGEEDPHGADMRGNPLGSLFYTSAFGAGPSSAYKQAHEWHYFVGGGIFCLKVCDPESAQGPQLCQHIYDRIGCAYNAPANYAAINGTFQSCAGDNQLPPGVYVGDNGRTSTYTQPPESDGVISSIPYTAAIPATSQCTTFSSAAVFTELASASSSAVPSSITSAASSLGSAASGSAKQQAAKASSSGATTAPSSSASRGVLATGVLAFAGMVGFLVLA